MRPDPDKLARLARAMGVPAPVWLDEVDSTQQVVRTWADEGRPGGISVVAEHQLAGRGRLGRQWTSPPGTGLQLSVLLRPGLSPSRLPLISLAAAVAVREAAGEHLGIKWPNDLQGPDGRKVAGILAEADVQRGSVSAVLLGIGINVSGAPDLPTAACLADYGTPPSREQLAVGIVAHVLQWTDRIARSPASVLAAWRRGDTLRGRTVRVLQHEGRAAGIADDGALLLDTAQGRVVVRAGDVEMVGLI